MTLSISNLVGQMEGQCKKAYNEISSEDVKRIATDCAIKALSLVMAALMRNVSTEKASS